MFIYKITNKITGMIYIGQTIGTIERRWNDHVSSAKQRSGGRFYRAINKYGRDGFTVEQLATAISIEELNILEEQLILEYDCLAPKGYNILPGGKNRRHHEETKAKLREALHGRPIANRWNKGFLGSHAQETKDKISAKLKGRPIKNRMNGAPKGRPVSPERRAQISATMTGVAQPWKYKPVMIVETGALYVSINEAAAATGLGRTTVTGLLKSGKRHKKTGFTFKFLDQTPDNK